MKKRMLVFLFCLSSTLLVHVVRADESGFGGELVVSGKWESGQLSRLDADEGKRRINGLNEPGYTDSYLAPFLGGELRYTLPNGHSSFYLTNLSTDSDIELGFRTSFGDMGGISVAYNHGDRKVWQDPYLVGVLRRSTDEKTNGVSFKFENILGSGCVFSSNIKEVNIDEDRVGDREKLLLRDGYRAGFKVGYVIDLNENSQIVPMVHYKRCDLKGAANSSDGYEFGFKYEWIHRHWVGETSATVGWTNYHDKHPDFKKERQSENYHLSTLIGYSEPFGWSQVTLYGMAAYMVVEENIDFFDSEILVVSLGVSYEF